MIGGWTTKQVARLLVKHGLRDGGGGGGGRRKGRGDDDDEMEEEEEGWGGGGGGSGGEVIDVEASLDPPHDPQVRSPSWDPCSHFSHSSPEDPHCCPLSSPVPYQCLYLTLRFL